MTSAALARLGRMTPAEIQWRVGSAFRNGCQRAMAAVRPSIWDRMAIREAIADPSEIEYAIRSADWIEAHRALSRQIVEAPQRFVIAPSMRTSLGERIVRAFPRSAEEAKAGADRIADGAFDLLGYRGLRFDRSNGAIDWHYDPVSGRRAPADLFWSAVPFLDPACGDHKVIWELNRHQYWMVLGRAFWLTGDSRYRTLAIAHLESWMSANPPLVGANWASMLELAFRSLSWIWALHFFCDERIDDQSPWVVDLLVGLDRQLDHVERNLSRYFSPNTHLLGEALALYVAGRSLPLLASSARRTSVGRSVLIDEIDRQIGHDGGYLERSTHYHRYALDFYTLALVVARITNDTTAIATFVDAVDRLAHAARVLADDNGVLPHIGDDDGGGTMPMAGRRCDDVRDSLWSASVLLDKPELRIGPCVEEPHWLLAHGMFDPALRRSGETASATLGVPPSTALPETGYYVSRSRDAHIVIDAGPHGFMNGGHAHADALSLTLTLRGTPLLIDPGTGCYTTDPQLRDRLRSSALHNTIAVDGRPQSTPAGPFSWAQTANATVHCWRTNRAFDYLDASHDGYAAVSITHRRHVLVCHDDVVIVADLVTAADSERHDIHAYWHLGPDWNARVMAGSRVALERDGERVTLLTTAAQVDVFCGDADAGEPQVGWHAPVYGCLEPAPTLRCAVSASAPCWLVSVFAIGANVPQGLRIVSSVHAGGAPALAMWIDREQSTDFLAIANSAGPEDAAARREWSTAGFTSDARVLFCSAAADSNRVAMVDGSFVRGSGDRPFDVNVPTLAPHLSMAMAPSDSARREA